MARSSDATPPSTLGYFMGFPGRRPRFLFKFCFKSAWFSDDCSEAPTLPGKSSTKPRAAASSRVAYPRVAHTMADILG